MVLIITRLIYTDTQQTLPLKMSTWDALGYYLYLPAKYIYHDEENLGFIKKMDSSYQLSGGDFYQASQLKNGHYACKYLMGVSILQTPFFFIAHQYALRSAYPADGFSYPYQIAIAWGCLFYSLISLLLLRHILLKYFEDKSVGISLILLMLASNAIQYIGIEAGQSHGYIFPLYVFILYFTIKWHENYSLKWMSLIGLTLGLAVISRPTELVMVLIPTLWDTNQGQKNKWAYLKMHPLQLIILAISGFVAVLPQLIYWKKVTGSWVYDVGSKWDFLSPHFRVLIGWEKGWMIYTPVAVFMLLGLWFLAKKPYKKAIIAFSLVNIYIIISWHIWRYGGSYSCRALVQSYPIWAFPLTALTSTLLKNKARYLFLLVSIYLLAVNLFQIKQYNRNILHYDDMNFAYYKAIYLNPSPSPKEMSLLDTKEIIRCENEFEQKLLAKKSNLFITNSTREILDSQTMIKSKLEVTSCWLKISAKILVKQGYWGSYLQTTVIQDQTSKEEKVRLFNALCKEGNLNEYVYFIRLDARKQIESIRTDLIGDANIEATLSEYTLELFSK